MKTLFRLLILLLIFVIGIISFALTPTGLKVAMKIAKPLIPGNLSYQTISGVIIGPIVVHDLRYSNKDETIDIKSLVINWQPMKLFQREFQISSLSASDVMIKIHNPLLTQKFDENTAKEWIAHAMQSFQRSDSLFHIVIHHTHLKAITLSDNHNQVRALIQQLSLRSIITPEKWNMYCDIAFLQPHPFTLQFHLTGKPSDYHFHIIINGYQTSWSMIGHGDINNIHVATDKTRFLNGAFSTQWNIHWGKNIIWGGFLKADQWNTALIEPQWVAPISINIVSRGHTGVQFQTTTHATITIPTAALQLNLLHNNQWRAQWNLTVSSLSHWFDNAQGALQSQGTLKGDLQNPRMHIQINGKYTNPSLTIQKMTLLLTGTVLSHTLSAHIALPKDTVDFAIAGKLKGKQWQGQLQQFTVDFNDNGIWHLNNTAQLNATKNSFAFTPICLEQNGIGDACIIAHALNKNITAQTNIHLSNLNWMRHFFPAVKIPSGKLNADMQFNGTLEQPNVTGNIYLNHARLQIPAINITLRDITASINGQNHLMHFNLTAFSKQQPIRAQGSVDLADTNYPVKMHVTSKNALVINTAQYIAYATSNLNMTLIGKNLQVTGNLTLPKALIAPNDFQNTHTLPKDDIVYVGAIIPKAENAWSVSTNINGHLGNNVELNVAGIATKLQGDLQLVKHNSDDYFATGELFLHNGLYHVYGQTLTIEPHSYITYTHSLLNNPGLSIRASKFVENIDNFGGVNSEFSQKTLLVGISMTGTVKAPRIVFYSNHGKLSQADILSYILLGYGNNTNTPGNTDFLLRTLSAVNFTSQGLLGKQNIATQIQQGLGLREMGVESETTVDALGNPLNRQSAFVFGKRFSRHLYARYSIGLLDSVNIFQLRYFFNKHWAVQSDSSSLGNGADVLYTIDFN